MESDYFFGRQSKIVVFLVFVLVCVVVNVDAVVCIDYICGSIVWLCYIPLIYTTHTVRAI